MAPTISAPCEATVLGANDGIVSIASLIVGVATADATHKNVLVAGVAGLVAGAMSMAAGEYVSVSSQSDTERADLNREMIELTANEPAEVQELAAIYVGRGLEPELAEKVAIQLMAHDALGAHARDEIGISSTLRARLTPTCKRFRWVGPLWQFNLLKKLEDSTRS